MVDYSPGQFAQQTDYSIELFGYGFELLCLRIAHPILHALVLFRWVVLKRLRGQCAHCSLLFDCLVRMLQNHWVSQRTALALGEQCAV
jgi:hypothetical protein